MRKINWYRHKQDVSIDFLRQHWVKISRTQHDKAHLSANKLAVQSLQQPQTHCQNMITHMHYTHKAVPLSKQQIPSSHTLFPPPGSLHQSCFSSIKVCTHMLTHHNNKLTEMTTNLFRPCRSICRHKINTQSDWIRRAWWNIWPPIRLSDNHPRIIFRIHSFTMLFFFHPKSKLKESRSCLDILQQYVWGGPG